jgi:Papain-like cysteine protease AvrRpt2
MAVYLNVPFVSQLNYGHNNKENDPTGCWYSSVCMVGYYFEQGPRLGVPELHTGFGKTTAERLALEKYLGYKGHAPTGSTQSADIRAYHGVTEHEHDLLARRERLAPVPDCDSPHVYTPRELESYLRNGGPIFFYWNKTHGSNTYGHASVIIGVNDAMVMYHDPEEAPGAGSSANSRVTLAGFNGMRQQCKYGMMQRVTTHVAATGVAGLKAKFGG